MVLLLDGMHLLRPDVGFSVFSLDPQGCAKSIGRQLSARDEPPDLLLAKAQVPGGLPDGLEGVVGGPLTAR